MYWQCKRSDERKPNEDSVRDIAEICEFKFRELHVLIYQG
jgi:hypothetical protein